jgi:hypothetical protein
VLTSQSPAKAAHRAAFLLPSIVRNEQKAAYLPEPKSRPRIITAIHIMRKQTPLTRYNAAPHNEFAHYAAGLPMRHLCRTLNRSERTIRDWLKGAKVIPPWAIAVLRLNHLERDLIRDQMGITAFERERQAENRQPVIKRRPAANEDHFASQPPLDIATKN